MMSTGTQSFKSDNLIKNLFLKKIKEYESKMTGKEDGLVDATPEVKSYCHFIFISRKVKIPRRKSGCLLSIVFIEVNI